MRQWRTRSPGRRSGSCLLRSAQESRSRSPSAAVAYAAGHYGEQTQTVTSQAIAPSTTAAPSARVSPQVAAGAHTFVQFGCVDCHGMQGRGGVDPAVPALKTVGHSLTVAQLTHIIDHGLGESANPKQPYMPVWGEVISKTQVSNLVAYIRAGLPAVADTQPRLGAERTGSRGRRRSALRPLRLRQLPRPERPRRRAEPAVARQDDPRSRARVSGTSSIPTRRSPP